jgi:class 3 adenylate cyclase
MRPSPPPSQAVLVIDMCGFSRLMEEQGVDAALEAVERLQEVARAATEAMGGRVVKVWADNVMALFPDVRSAVLAAKATMALVPSASGVGWGPVHETDGDAFGVEVNNACRLGEDEAEGCCCLLTDAAKAEVGPTGGGAPAGPGPSSVRTKDRLTPAGPTLHSDAETTIENQGEGACGPSIDPRASP